MLAVEVVMRALMLVVVMLAGCAGMGNVHVLKRLPEEHLVALGVALGIYEEPTAQQRADAKRQAKRLCGGSFTIVDEGLDSTTSPYFSMYGNVAAAGTYKDNSYHWIVRCSAQEAQPVSAPEAQRAPGERPDTVRGFVAACRSVLNEQPGGAAGYCLGYLEAVIELLDGEPFCVKQANVSRAAAALRLADFVGSSAEMEQWQLMHAVTVGLQRTFPCARPATLGSPQPQ